MILVYRNKFPPRKWRKGVRRLYVILSEGDWVYGNTPGIEYTIDKTKILTDIDVDLRTNLGTPALLGEGSTITFKIDKIRQLPLVLQEKK